MLASKDFRRIAREALKGRWLVAVGTGLIAALLGGTILSAGYSGGNGSRSSASSIAGVDGTQMLEGAMPDAIIPNGGVRQLIESFANDAVLTNFLLAAISVTAFFAILYAVATMIIGGAISLGYAKFNLNLVNGGNAKVDDLFSQLSRFKTGFVLNFLTTLYIVLWTLLFIIPGIVAALSYSMAPYILYENPDMTASEAIKASKELMKGNKDRLFMLSLSFIGWHILCAFTFGIGNLFLRPYIEASGAAFYQTIKAERNMRDNQHTVQQ